MARSTTLVYRYPRGYRPTMSPRDRPWPDGWRFRYPGNDPENGPAEWQYCRLLHWLDLCFHGNRPALLRDLGCNVSNRVDNPIHRTVHWMGKPRNASDPSDNPEAGFIFIIEPRIPGGGCRHRLMTICPSCGTEVPVGRAHQHVHGRRGSGPVTRVCSDTANRERQAEAYARREVKRLQSAFIEANGRRETYDEYCDMEEAAYFKGREKWGLR